MVYPDRNVVAIAGDGGFMMNSQELETAVRLNLNIVVIIINDKAFGMIKWKQAGMGFPNFGMDMTNPDFVKLAEAYGCVGLACDSPEDVDATITKAMEINDVPVVVDFRVHRDAMVWPMVAAGTSNDEIKYARDMAPKFDEDDL